jgi:hypothetical protein
MIGFIAAQVLNFLRFVCFLNSFSCCSAVKLRYDSRINPMAMVLSCLGDFFAIQNLKY